MGKIKELSQDIIAKIAAGEVIERPSYAVKELLDNAIDAGADSINIYLEDAGLKSITMIDNGEGMSKEDLLVSFHPHTTSKLTNEDELYRINSLGFRGEALWSIASISNLTLKSRQKSNAAGYLVELKGGVLKAQSLVGMPMGTHITVQQLFSSVPARKKFLKSQTTELRHIIEIVTNAALAYPTIQFILKHHKKIIIDLPKNQTQEERIQWLLGEKFVQQLISVSFEDSYISLKGFIASPQFTTNSSHKQYLFINDRRVTDLSIAQVVKEAYGNLIAQTALPIFFLFLSLPYETVDVNIHPRKEQVSLTHAKMIHESIKNVVQSALGQRKAVVNQEVLFEKVSRRGGTNSFAGQLLKETTTPWKAEDIGKMEEGDILQLHNLYLISQTKQGMMLIDQHAAHERILYEQFKSAFHKQKEIGEGYDLKAVTLLHLSPTEFLTLREHEKMFAKLGFFYEEFAGNSIKITSIPKIFKDRDIERLLGEMLEDLQEGSIKDVDAQTDLMLSYLACRAAIKAGDQLTQEEMKRLVQELEKTPHNLSCPHGRPTKIEIPLTQLHKLFHRT